MLNEVHRYYAAGASDWTFELAWPPDFPYPAFRVPNGLYLRTNASYDSPTGSISPPYAAMTYMQGLPPGNSVDWQEISAEHADNQYRFQHINPSVDVSGAFAALRKLREQWWAVRYVLAC